MGTIHQVVYTLIVVSLLSGSAVLGQRHAATFVPVAPEILLNSPVHCFFKDSHGYLWIGTAEGLMRYNGTNVVRYEHDPEDLTSIPHNLINVITEDSNKTLWIGTGKGLIKFNRELDNFINVDSIPGSVNHLNNRFITALSFDHLGHLWIGTHGDGINVYNPATLTFRYMSHSAHQQGIKSSEFITSIICADDLIWCATRQGIELYNATDMTRASLSYVGSGVPGGEVSQVARDNAGTIWLASATGDISKLTERNGYYTCKTVVSGQAKYGASWVGLRALTADAKGNFWIAGENSGLNYLDTRTGEVTRFLTGTEQWGSLPTNSIISVYVDNTGLTWIGTVNQGAYLIDDNSGKFNLYDSISRLTGKIIRGIAEDPQGRIWLAFEGIGLAVLDSGKLIFQDQLNRHLTNKFLTSLICDRNGDLWIGTAGGGVYTFKSSNSRLQHFNVVSGGLGDNKLYCLYEDKEGNIWAGSAGSGLFSFDVVQKKFIVLAETGKSNHIPGTTYVSSVYEDSEGVLWVGTLYGLYTVKGHSNGSREYSWHGQAGPGTLSSNGIQTVFEDRRKNLWVATSDNGLNVRWKGTSDFQTFKKNDGLVSNTIRGLITDSKGNLWISTNMGLSKFDIITRSFKNYSRNDGLASNNFSENVALRSTRGALFFGSNNGFNSFYPDSLSSDHSQPIVYLSDLKINNQSVKIGDARSPLTKHISLSSEVELDHNQRSFTVHFAAINYAHGTRYSYCYMLKGFDSDWNCLASNHSANYTNIDPGRYVFLVKASNSNGVWSDEPTQLIIIIRPAPWKTWWAIIIYCVVISSIVYFLLRFRTDRIRIQTQLNLERVAHERERELIQSKMLFFTNVSHEFRTPLSLILLPLETLMTSVHVPAPIKNKISIAHKSAEKMMTLVNELMDFNKAESGTLKLHVTEGDVALFVREVTSSFHDLALRRNIRFSVPEGGSVKGYYDSGKLQKIIFNLLSNAFKFTSDGGEISVLIREKVMVLIEGSDACRCLELIIVDNGIGIDANEIPLIFDKFYQAKSAAKIANPGTGIGLSLTKALVELHGGKITAVSSGGATRFTVTLPVENLPAESLMNETSLELIEGEDISEEIHSKVEILLVEDNIELRQYLASELRAEFTVFECSNGAEGIIIAREKVPDLVISDILMASTNGLELCKALKSDVKTSHIPVILLTAKASVEEQIVGIESGADLYISKPFNYQCLLTHVRNIVNSRRKLYAHFSKEVYLLPAKVATNELDQAFLQRAIEHIVAHIQDSQLGVDSIATLFNLSRVHVYRKIKALTGKAVVELIRSVRLKQALKLMETKKYTLSEVAYLAGFNSASYFTRSFKEEYGKAPSEFLGTQ